MGRSESSGSTRQGCMPLFEVGGRVVRFLSDQGR